MLRGIFRKRRHLVHLLFKTATDTLRDAFRTRLALPDGRIAAAAAVHTFGDYLLFHPPHLHILAADGLFDKEGRFHGMPAEHHGPMNELFRIHDEVDHVVCGYPVPEVGRQEQGGVVINGDESGGHAGAIALPQPQGQE